MDELTAGAMRSDVQVSLYTQHKILKYKHHGFGSKVIIPETKIHHVGSGCVTPEFGVYYNKNTPEAKPEICNYWTRRLAELCLQSTKRLL